MNSLHEVVNTLRVVLGNEALFSLVSTRITLKTGVDLQSADLSSQDKPETLAQVLSALQAMGYSEQSLKVIAKAKAAAQI